MKKLLSRLLATLAVGLLSGCLFNGGGSSAGPDPTLPLPGVEPPPPPMVAYVTGLGADLTSFDVDPTTGGLTQLSPPIEAGFNPMQVVVDPASRFAYVAAYDSRSVRSFRLDPASHLPSFADESQLLPDFRVRSVAVHPSGKFVYGTDEINDRVAMFAVDSTTGELTAMAPETVAAGDSPYFIVAHPNGKFAYVANIGDDTIGVYEIDETTGVLTERPERLFSLPAAAANPTILAIDSAGEFLYLGSTGAASESITAFAVDSATGALTLLGTPLSFEGQNPEGIAVHPSGKFVYVAAEVGNLLSAYAIVSNTLTFIDSFAAGDLPSDVAVDVTGKFVYVTNRNDSTIRIFSIDQTTGALMPRGQPFALPAGYSPLSIAISEKK